MANTPNHPPAQLLNGTPITTAQVQKLLLLSLAMITNYGEGDAYNPVKQWSTIAPHVADLPPRVAAAFAKIYKNNAQALSDASGVMSQLFDSVLDDPWNGPGQCPAEMGNIVALFPATAVKSA